MMINLKTSLSIDEKLLLANRQPPSADYLIRLHGELSNSTWQKETLTHRLKSIFLQPVWIVTFSIIVLMALGMMIIGPQRVYAEVAKLFGYIPGVGIVDQQEAIRILVEPVSLTRDGITVTVSEVTLTKEKTRLIYKVENTPDSALSHDENVSGCSEQAYLLLSTGVSLRPIAGWGSEFSNSYDFAPIPEEVTEATFVLPCINNTLPGKAPENWKIPLHFSVAPAGMTVAPIIDLATPIVQAFTSTPQVDDSVTLNNLYGIVLSLEKVIPLADGYYLVGNTGWKDNRIADVSPASWNMKAYDANGQEVPIEPVYWDEAGLTPGDHQWLYKLFGTGFNGPITLRATEMSITFTCPVDFQLDLANQGFDGSEAQIGSSWKGDLMNIDLPELTAVVDQIKYIKSGDLKGFELIIQADPVLQQLPLNITSGLDFSGLSMINGGGGSNRDSNDGQLKTTMLTNAKINFPLVLSATGATINGHWEVKWQPPAVNDSPSPTPVASACVTLERWQQVLKDPAVIPVDLSQRVLVNRGALAPEPSLFITNLDGSGNQGLAFGNGSMSKNGSTLVYSDNVGNIKVRVVATGIETVLTHDKDDNNPLFSPDGSQIAFTRRGDDQQIFVMNADGSEGKLVVPGGNYPQAWGWTPDGGQILFWTKTSERSSLIQLADPLSGEITPLFALNSASPEPAISPDGKWIAYLDRVPGRMSDGLFVAQLDGTHKRLLIQLDYWQLVGKLTWTPDGNWISFSVLNSEALSPISTVGLVNLNSCQVIPLPQLNGVILDWVSE